MKKLLSLLLFMAVSYSQVITPANLPYYIGELYFIRTHIDSLLPADSTTIYIEGYITTALIDTANLVYKDETESIAGNWAFDGKNTYSDLNVFSDSVEIDNIRIESNKISTTAGTDLNITPLAGEDLIIDSHWEFDNTDITALTNNNSTLIAYTGKNFTIESVTFDGGEVGGISDLTISGTFTDGTFSSTAGAFTGLISLSDGTASWSSNNLSGFVNITATSTIQAEQLTSTDDALIKDDLTLGDDVANASGKIIFIASDGDTGNAEINTSDQFVFSGFSGGVDVDGDATVGTLASDGTISGTAITGTSFVIGANTLDTNEWVFLDGHNQSVFTTSTPSFPQISITDSAFIDTLKFNRIYGLDSLNVDSLNFVPDLEMTNLKAQTLTAGDGLSGGGDLSANRSFAVNVDFDGAIETVDDSLNIKLDGSTLTKGASGLKLTTHTGDVTGDTGLTIGADKVHDSMIDWGMSANQVNSADVPDYNNHTVRDVFVNIVNRGKSDTLTITETGGLGVSWTACELYDTVSDTFFATQSGSGTLVNNDVNYLKWASSDTLIIEQSSSINDEVLIATFSVYDGVINGHRSTSELDESLSNTRRGLRALFQTRIVSGMLISEDTDATNPLDVTMDAGILYKEVIEKMTPVEIKSRNTAMVRHFHTASAWDSDTNIQIETTNYDNGTQKTAIPSNKWVKSLFLYMDGKIGWVYPTEYFTTEAQALEASLPTTPPGLEPIPKLVALVYKQGTSAFTTATFQDIRAGISEESFNIVSDHGALAGLGDDDHAQYFALAQNETITGETTFEDSVNYSDGTDEYTIDINADKLQIYNDANTQVSLFAIDSTKKITVAEWNGQSISDTYLDNNITITPINATTESAIEDSVEHDDLQGYVSNEHIDHTGVTLTAGTNLNGGGTIAANRTFNLDDPITLNRSNFDTLGIETANANLVILSRTVGDIILQDSTYITGLVTITGDMSATNYSSDGSVSDAELKYINTLGSNAQTQLDARCLESVFGTAIGTGLVLDATTLKTSTGLQSFSGLTLTAGDMAIATGANAWNVLDHGATTTILVGGGTNNPVWTTATGTGAPARADSPTFTTQITTGDIIAGANTYDIGSSGTRFNLIYGDSIHANWFGGSDFELGESGSDITIDADSLKGSPVWLGNLAITGTVDGIDIATDVAANTTHRGLTNNPHSVTPTQLSLVIGTNTQAHDNALDNISGLTYVSPSFIKLTGNDTYAVRTLAESLSDLSGVAGSAFAWNSQNLTGIGTIGSGAITSTGHIQGLTGGFGLTQTEGTVHILTASAGAAVANIGSDELVLENSSHTGMTILSPDASRSQIYFGSPTNVIGAYFRWEYDDLQFDVGSLTAGASTIIRSGEGATAITIDGNQDITVNSGNLTITDGLTTTGAEMTLSSKELTVVDGDILGKIDFKAGIESSGTDAILAGASIWAEADSTFEADDNSTSLILATGVSGSATEKMRIASDGDVNIAGELNLAKHLFIKNYKTDTAIDHPLIEIQNSNGTVGSPTYLDSSEEMGALVFRDRNSAGGSGMSIFATEDQGAASLGSNMYLFTTPNGSTTKTMNLIIDQNGYVGIGDVEPLNPLHVVGAGKSTGATLRLHNKYQGADWVAKDKIGEILFYSYDAGGSSAPDTTGTITSESETTGAYVESSALTFSTQYQGTLAEAMRINAQGKVGIGTAVPVNLLNVDGAYNFFADSSSVNDSWGFSTTGIEVMTTGMTLFVQIAVVNTDGATLQINALGAKAVHKQHNVALATGDVEVGQILHLVYDGTDFQMLSQLAQ